MHLSALAVAAGPRPTATLIAALVAAAATIAVTVVRAVNAAKSRTRDDREQWWTRFVSAINRAMSDDVEQSQLGLTILLDVIRTPWASKADDETALAVADLISARARPRRHRDRRRTA